MQRLPLRLRFGLLLTLAGAVFAATLGWSQAEHGRAALAQSRPAAGQAPPREPAEQPQLTAPPREVADRSISRLRVQVETGDTLFAIARRYGVALADLLGANRDVQAEALFAGQELALPASAMGGLGPDLQPYQGLFAWPLDAPLTSPFGPRWGRMHAGIDFAAEPGAPIRAARAGKVTTAGSMNDYGLTVILTHADGTKTLYGHCSTLRVKVGEMVEVGRVIAEVGSTGLSTGPHLHFEIHIDDEPRNPLLLLLRNG